MVLMVVLGGVLGLGAGALPFWMARKRMPGEDKP
jgi:hypothetical protein